MGKKIIIVLTFCCIMALFCCNSYGKAPVLCKPVQSILIFETGGNRLKMRVDLSYPKATCSRYNRVAERVVPSKLEISYKKRKYQVPNKCVSLIEFDLHGIEVEFGPQFLTVWFGKSLKETEDLFSRDGNIVGIEISDDGLQCVTFGRKSK